MRPSTLATVTVIVLLAGICKLGTSDDYIGEKVYYDLCQDSDYCVHSVGLGEGHCCDITDYEKQGNYGICKPDSMAKKCVSPEEEAKLPREPYYCQTTAECHKGRPGKYPPAPLTCCDMTYVKYRDAEEGECRTYNSTPECPDI